MNGNGHRRAADWLLGLAVFAAAFFYRFNTMGGALGGFTNDEFGYLARARQIQSGELPFRDFNDPGWFLTDGVAAAAQWLGGYNLRSEAVLTIGMLALGAAMTFALARRASGSVIAALIAIAIHIALDVRHYNYPKIVLYATGLVLAWRYVDKPSRGRLAALGALVGVGFLFRHDHLVYLGALALMTIAFVHRASVWDGVRATAGVALVAAVFIGPFLVFLALNGGVGEYFRAAFVYIARDANRTEFSFPRLSLDFSRPLVTVGRGPADTAAPRINVRWGQIPGQQRIEAESRYHLEDGQPIDGETWTYLLRDTSKANISALVHDPGVDDTHGLDRGAYTLTVAPEPLRLQSQLDTLSNATAFLYYCFLSLPLLAAGVLWRVRGASDSMRVLRNPAYMVPLIVLATMLNVSFMSRGSTNIRIPDVGVTAAILIAWLLTVVSSRDGGLVFTGRGIRLLARVACVAILGLTLLSANGLAQGVRTARDAGLAAGPAELLRRARMNWAALAVDPGAFAADEEQLDILKVARYIRACTSPADRLFVLGEYPALYYFADRRFAGGHAWLLPLYYTDDEDEARIVARLRAASVPIVVTEDRSTYREDYQPVFEQVHDYLERNYVDAGEVAVGGSRSLRVLVRSGLESGGRYEPLGLPCATEPR